MIKISRRLYVRVALAIAMVALVIAFFASSISYYFGLDAKQNTHYILAEQLAATVEKTAEIAAYINDAELAQEIVNGLMVNDLIQGAKITNDSGLNTTVGGISTTSQKISIQLKHPFIPDLTVGSLELFIDEQFVKQQTRETTQKEILILVAHSIIIAFFVSLIVHRKLTRPVQNLIDSFAGIDPTNPRTMRMLTSKSNDEVGKLAKGINSLMHELHHSFNQEKDLRIQTQVLESKFRLIFEQASAGICLVDEQDNISAFNPAFAGYFSIENQQDDTVLHFPTLLSNPDRLNQLLREIRLKSTVEQVALDIECEVGGVQKWMHCLFAKVTDQRDKQRESAGTIVEVILYDVTERAERELQTRFEADHDSLTHLLNRRSGEKKLHKMLYSSIKEQRALVLMMIDLDKFKPVNDKYGHEAGDKVLVTIAKRLTELFNDDNSLCIRWGGDEFVVTFFIEQTDHSAIIDQANSILCEIQKPVVIHPDVSCKIDASVGIVIAPEHGRVLHELLVNADNTMYKVKEQGRGRVELFSATLNQNY